MRRLLPLIAGDRRPGGPTTTDGAPHIRDAMSSRRAMNIVLIALMPSLAVGLYSTGLLENAAVLAAGKSAAVPGWRGAVLAALGIPVDPTHIGASLFHGLLYFVPLFLVVATVGRIWEALFAAIRRRDPGDGIMVIALLLTLAMPAAVPLWQAALTMSFAIVMGREIFGGMGRNFLNPALTGLAFLYVTYPASMTSETVWGTVDGFSGATAVSSMPEAGLKAIEWVGTSWMQAFVGIAPGGLGNNSTLACLIGAAILLYTRVASARIMVGVVVGMVGASLALNAMAGEAATYAALTWRWHLVLGSFAFGAVFLATDPVSAAATQTGRWIYAILIGVLVVVIRVANHSHPDGVIFAVLLGNIFAPLIDYIVIQLHIRRRARRHG